MRLASHFPCRQASDTLAIMERDFPPEPADDKSQPPSAAEAGDILGRLSTDRSRLADQVVTPWWYHPALGVIMSVFVLAQVLEPPLSISLVALGIVAIPVLTNAYSRRYGISLTQPTGRGSGRMLLASVGILALAIVGALAIRLTGVSLWWVLPLAVSAFVATVVFGRRYDKALRTELAQEQSAA